MSPCTPRRPLSLPVTIIKTITTTTLHSSDQPIGTDLAILCAGKFVLKIVSQITRLNLDVVAAGDKVTSLDLT